MSDRLKRGFKNTDSEPKMFSLGTPGLQDARRSITWPTVAHAACARPAAAQVQPRDAPLFDRGERRPSPASCGSPRRGNQDCGFCPRACRLAHHALHNFRSRHEPRLASDCVVKVRRLQTRTLGVREACDLAPHPRPPAQATPLGPRTHALDVPSGDAARPKPGSERRVPSSCDSTGPKPAPGEMSHR